MIHLHFNCLSIALSLNWPSGIFQWTFAAGVFCGLLIGPLIDLLSLMFLRWPLHNVVARAGQLILLDLKVRTAGCETRFDCFEKN